MNTPSFQTLVNEILEANGWSTYRLATEIGVSQATVSRLSTGDVEEPRSYAIAQKLVELHANRPKAA